MYLLGKQISSTIEDREEPAPAQLWRTGQMLLFKK